MVYYTEDGRQISEEEAMKLGSYRVFRDEAAAVKAFDRQAAEAQAKQPTMLDKAASAYMATGDALTQNMGHSKDSLAMKRVELQNQLKDGKITEFEFRKAMEELDNPPENIF